MTWTIRRAERIDAPSLASLGARLFRQTYESTHPEPTLSIYLSEHFTEARFEVLLADPDVSVLVVDDGGGRLVGYAQLRTGTARGLTTVLVHSLPGERPLEIVRFYVDREWHGRGLAAALMQACEARARVQRADVLWLLAWQEAGRALAFYAKSGFRIIGTGTFMFGQREDADYLLARPLAAEGRAPSSANAT